MESQQLIINNATLYDIDKPFFYKNISISDILLHKLAGYNGVLEKYASVIADASKDYKYNKFVFNIKRNYHLKEILILDQIKKEAHIFFFSPFFF